MPDTQGGWQAELSTNRLGIGCCGAAKQGVYGLLLGTRTKHPGMGESNKWQIVGHTNPPHPARAWALRIREPIDLSLRNFGPIVFGLFLGVSCPRPSNSQTAHPRWDGPIRVIKVALSTHPLGALA